MGTSHQKGWVSVRGKKWYGYFRRTLHNCIHEILLPAIQNVPRFCADEVRKVLAIFALSKHPS
jgi:hypothetical protein